MKRLLIAGSSIALFLLAGCGSAGEREDNGIDKTSESYDATRSKGSYNLWEYMTPANSHTSTYTVLSNGNRIKYSTNYSVKQNRVVEVSDYVSNEKTIYERYTDKIKVRFEKNNRPNGMYDLKLYVNIGDRITVRDSSCKLNRHIDDFELKGKHFSDVLEVKCGDKPGYYQKGVGEIAQIDDNAEKSIRVLSK